MAALPVNEVFESIQGEAHWVGTPSVFLRLQGCDVGCPWCDTSHTWTVDPTRAVPTAKMRAKTEDSPDYAWCDTTDLVETVAGHTARHVVITGGEPCAHDLHALTGDLIRLGRRVQIETSGTQPIRIHPDTWVTLSPKIGMPGGRHVRPEAVARADELKIPVGKPEDVERALPLIALRRPGVDVWLQPLSGSAKATALCIEAATERGWRVSVQVHRFLGVR